MKDKSEKKTKVALVAPSLAQIGGQSIQANRLLEAFAGDEKIELIFIPNNPATFGQNVKFLRTITISLKFWSALLKQIRDVNLVHIFSSGTTSYIISTIPALFAARLYGKKTVLHYHTGEAEMHLKNWRLTAAPTMKMFDEIVVPSQFLVNVFGKFGLKATIISNFVETEKFDFRQRKPLRPVFLANRNFEAHYQVGDVLRAFSLIQEKHSEARLIVAGYGSEEAKIKKIAIDLRLENVEFAGRVAPEEMPEFYEKADIYLNSSIVDNMPLSIIEAFSCGLPVVTTDAGGIPFILEHEKTGLMVKTGDYKALAAAAMRLLEDESLASAIINNAREYCRKFTPEKVRAEWRNLYEKLSSSDM
jgi:glycosyltransferase involved in cell wall biosynthesis